MGYLLFFVNISCLGNKKCAVGTNLGTKKCEPRTNLGTKKCEPRTNLGTQKGRPKYKVNTFELFMNHVSGYYIFISLLLMNIYTTKH